jgi:hypothetical protein
MESHLIHILHYIKLSQVMLQLTLRKHGKISNKEDQTLGKFLREIFQRIEVHLIIKISVRVITQIMYKWHLSTSNINRLRVKEKQF